MRVYYPNNGTLTLFLCLNCPEVLWKCLAILLWESDFVRVPIMWNKHTSVPPKSRTSHQGVDYLLQFFKNNCHFWTIHAYCKKVCPVLWLLVSALYKTIKYGVICHLTLHCGENQQLWHHSCPPYMCIDIIYFQLWPPTIIYSSLYHDKVVTCMIASSCTHMVMTWWPYEDDMAITIMIISWYNNYCIKTYPWLVQCWPHLNMIIIHDYIMIQSNLDTQ